MVNAYVEYLNANLEADFFPEVFTPLKVEDYLLGVHNRRVEGTILDKYINSDLDGVWNSKDSRTFAEGWVESIGNQYGFNDAQKKDILKNLVIAQKTFDKERAKKAIKPLIDAGMSYEANLEACIYGANEPNIVAGAIQFRNEMLKSGYAFILNSLSPVEMVEIVGHERLGIPKGNCFGTRLFDKNKKILPEPEWNFSPVKKIHVDEYRPEHGLTKKSLEVSLSDDISDLHMKSTVGLHPFVWVTDSNEITTGVRLKYPEGRDYIFPLARKLQQYEVSLIEIVLGKDPRLSCRRSLEARKLFDEFKTNADLESRLRKSVADFVDGKTPAIQRGSTVRIQRLLNTMGFKSHLDKIKIFEKILYSELKTYTFEFSSKKETVQKFANFPTTTQQDHHIFP